MIDTISPEEARDLAEALWEAAERAERRHRPYEVSQLGSTYVAMPVEAGDSFEDCVVRVARQGVSWFTDKCQTTLDRKGLDVG